MTKLDGRRVLYGTFATTIGPKRMDKKTLLATLRETLREVSEKLARSDAALIRMREELATFEDILHHAKQREIRARQEYEQVFTQQTEPAAAINSAPKSYPPTEKIGELSAAQTRTQSEWIAARESVRKYDEHVRLAELEVEIEELNRKSLKNAWDDLSWQIDKLSAARR